MLRTAALALASTAAAFSCACMSVGPAPVRFAGQRNIIVWDAERGIENFVRDARFETKGHSLGFIAPSPTRPNIVAVDPAAFDLFKKYESGYGLGGGFGGGGMTRGVAVVERKLVAGYEATVLKASDPRELAAWLAANGYPSPRYAERWTAPYVRRGWYLTAFKVATGEGAGATGPVRMSFQTKTPFNPYSVPAENSGRGGLLLYYVSATGEEPKIGGVQDWIAPAWTKPLKDADAAELAKDLKLNRVGIPENSTVRLYDDPNFGRPNLDDVYFVPAPKPETPALPKLLGLFALVPLAFIRVGRRSGP